VAIDARVAGDGVQDSATRAAFVAAATVLNLRLPDGQRQLTTTVTAEGPGGVEWDTGKPCYLLGVPATGGHPAAPKARARRREFARTSGLEPPTACLREVTLPGKPALWAGVRMVVNPQRRNCVQQPSVFSLCFPCGNSL
jgi:hypothetical protein